MNGFAGGFLTTPSERSFHLMHEQATVDRELRARDVNDSRREALKFEEGKGADSAAEKVVLVQAGRARLRRATTRPCDSMAPAERRPAI
jgi:hypothetical protein